jgi:hypothetical protein
MLMTRKIAAGCFAAMFGLAVSAGAQTPSTPQTPSPSTPSTPSSPSPSSPTASPTNPYPSAQAPSADRAGKEHKITGCIQAGTSASSFELTNVKKGESGATASAAPADAASKNVKLTAASGVDLAAHVGHTVEVTGSWAKSGDTGAAASPSTPPAAGASASAGMAKEFTVKNVKMVSSTCSAGTN